jgi:Kef-type K+ transport system membrane component KefB
VVLCLATAVGGLLAAFVDLPHTLGYILGGMLVGPSCLGFIKQVVQTETLAQFGSIFMLFGHGLIYSQHYRVPHHVDSLGVGSSHGDGSSGGIPSSASIISAGSGVITDTVTGGFVFVVSLFMMVLLLAVSTNVVTVSTFYLLFPHIPNLHSPLFLPTFLLPNLSLGWRGR